MLGKTRCKPVKRVGFTSVLTHVPTYVLPAPSAATTSFSSYILNLCSTWIVWVPSKSIETSTFMDLRLEWSVWGIPNLHVWKYNLRDLGRSWSTVW